MQTRARQKVQSATALLRRGFSTSVLSCYVISDNGNRHAPVSRWRPTAVYIHNQKLVGLGPTSKNVKFSSNRGRRTGRFGYLRHEHESVEIISNNSNRGGMFSTLFQLSFRARFVQQVAACSVTLYLITCGNILGEGDDFIT